MWRVVLLTAVTALIGCRGTLNGETYNKDSVGYRVVVPGEGWRRVDFADNDLAWLAASSGHVIAVNATCSDHEDPSLDVLTRHLVMGFTDREWKDRTTFTLDGREALRSKVPSSFASTSSSLELVVTKKNGCVHDFTYISPPGREGEQQARFDALVTGFRQERRH